MDAAIFESINYLAERVISAYGISIPICDIDKVVECIGGTVQEKADIDVMCDGLIWKDGAEHFCIAVSPYLSSCRRTFTIAQQLGHLFLHMGYLTNWKKWDALEETVYKQFGSYTRSVQANEFAAALLMPRDPFGEIIEEYTTEDRVDVVEVAAYLNVSPAALYNRGKLLGYF